MGIIILIIAAVIEGGLGVYCIATKSNHKRIRSWVHISAFATFVIFTLASVIQWSFRWKLPFYLFIGYMFLLDCQNGQEQCVL